MDPFLRFATAAARALTRYHRASLFGHETLPCGPALLAGNHGTFGLETPVFFYLLQQACGRLPFGLADTRLFSFEPMQSLLARVGGVPGTAQNALQLLERGELVVCYPGGSREVFKAPIDRNRLQWDRALGFAKIAIRAQVPVVPFAGLGVDKAWLNFGHLRALRGLGRYSPPVALGPMPVRLRFALGAPMEPPRSLECAESFKAAVQSRVESLLEGCPAYVSPAQEPAAVIS